MPPKSSGRGLHPWHDIATGPEPPAVVNAIIEIPTNERNKFELDKELGSDDEDERKECADLVALVTPIVKGLSEESLARTLTGTRRALAGASPSLQS